MKKMLTCCAILSLALSLFCVSALAADLEIQVSSVNESAVKVAQKSGSADPIFTVTQSSGAQSGQLYLVMIQQGTDASAKPLPTKDNLYYLNVEEASGTSFATEAYPRDMAEGTYIVYLSDYSGSNAGAAKGVATIKVSAKSSGGGSSGDSSGGGSSGGGSSGGDKIVYGDVDGDGNVKSWDATVLARYLAGQKEYQNINEKNADCDGNGTVKSWDLTILYRYLAGQSKYSELPDNPHKGD